jgi:hypothetical protein
MDYSKLDNAYCNRTIESYRPLERRRSPERRWDRHWGRGNRRNWDRYWWRYIPNYQLYPYYQYNPYELPQIATNSFTPEIFWGFMQEKTDNYKAIDDKNDMKSFILHLPNITPCSENCKSNCGTFIGKYIAQFKNMDEFLNSKVEVAQFFSKYKEYITKNFRDDMSNTISTVGI